MRFNKPRGVQKAILIIIIMDFQSSLLFITKRQINLVIQRQVLFTSQGQVKLKSGGKIIREFIHRSRTGNVNWS